MMTDIIKVVVSGGFGAGWSTWNTDVEGIATDPKLVELVEANLWADAEAYVCAKWGGGVYPRSLRNCEVVEVEKGELYQIHEYDGKEYRRYKELEAEKQKAQELLLDTMVTGRDRIEELEAENAKLKTVVADAKKVETIWRKQWQALDRLTSILPMPPEISLDNALAALLKADDAT